MSRKNCSAKSGKLIKIDEVKITEHLGEIVSGAKFCYLDISL